MLLWLRVKILISNMSLKAQSHKDTLWCYMKDTNICIKFTILERCLHYLMITPRRIKLFHFRIIIVINLGVPYFKFFGKIKSGDVIPVVQNL